MIIGIQNGPTTIEIGIENGLLPIATDGHANLLLRAESDNKFGHTFSNIHDYDAPEELTTFAEFLKNPLKSDRHFLFGFDMREMIFALRYAPNLS